MHGGFRAGRLKSNSVPNKISKNMWDEFKEQEMRTEKEKSPKKRKQRAKRRATLP